MRIEYLHDQLVRLPHQEFILFVWVGIQLDAVRYLLTGTHKHTHIGTCLCCKARGVAGAMYFERQRLTFLVVWRLRHCPVSVSQTCGDVGEWVSTGDVVNGPI
jgi:hypothetical protein